MLAAIRTGYCLTHFVYQALAASPLFCETTLERTDENSLKLTRHNGRSGKNGTYNPRHNDRRFDVEHSEHIATERVPQNIYWDCYRGVTTMQTRTGGDMPDFSFEQIEHAYYLEHYGDHIDAQNARNDQRRHSERNRTVDDLLKNNKTCPEETIYQIGTIEESVPPEILIQVVAEFYEEFERRFGSHVHILDWALHLDEGTPHIHERHVFDCENQYGELCPQQEKALEALGVPLPNPDKPKGRNNNRKQTFDAICRELLFEIAQKHGLQLDHEPEYGGRAYLEKQDYILAKQKEQLAQKEQEFAELILRTEEVETLIDEVSEIAYDKAVEVVTDTVREQTQAADLSEIEGYRAWANAPERKHSDATKNVINRCLDAVTGRLKKLASKFTVKIQTALLSPAARAANKAKVKERARESIVAVLEQKKVEIAQRDAERRAAQTARRDLEGR